MYTYYACITRHMQTEKTIKASVQMENNSCSHKCSILVSILEQISNKLTWSKYRQMKLLLWYDLMMYQIGQKKMNFPENVVTSCLLALKTFPKKRLETLDKTPWKPCQKKPLENLAKKTPWNPWQNSLKTLKKNFIEKKFTHCE